MPAENRYGTIFLIFYSLVLLRHPHPRGEINDELLSRKVDAIQRSLSPFVSRASRLCIVYTKSQASETAGETMGRTRPRLKNFPQSFPQPVICAKFN